MTPKQKLELEQSEKRQKLNELLGKNKLSDEERAELGTLTTRAQEIEVELRAAIVAEAEVEETETKSTGDPEERERLELRNRVKLADYVGAALEDRAVDGAGAEYNASIGLRRAGAFPLELLAPEPEQREERATTDASSQANQTRWLDRLFSETAAMHAGVTFESVKPGVASYPVTTAGASAAQRGRREAAADAAWTVGVTELKPSRNAVRAIFTEEDAMRLPGLEEGLRRDLGMALTEGVDRAIFLGDAGANEDPGDITGLQTATGVTEQEITQTNKVKPAETLAAFLAMVDGKHAGKTSDLRCVLTVGAYRLWSGTLANAAAENQTIMAFLKENGLSCMVRGDLEAATTNGKLGAFVGLGRGIAGAGVAAIWNSGLLIRDPYSGAAKGEVALTLSYFWNFGLPRASNFQRLKFVT